MTDRLDFGYPLMLRFLLLIVVIAAALGLALAHGVRGITIVLAVAVLAAAIRAPLFQRVAGALVRLTGSRRRAAALVMAVLIGALLAVTLYNLVR
ncbi:MAG TPA: hypothetical protein VFB58_03455 [Chloroflexota bacterium]|nr:hypothetical protein [Chloroflexota bacterium]